jgi:coproporphyrinogen III oxidase
VKNQFYNYIEGLQDQITSSLEAIDGLAKFEEDL